VLNGRAHISRRIVAGASLSALALTIGVQNVSFAEPSIEEVEERVGTLYHEAEVAQERLNDIRSQLGDKRARLDALKRDLKAQHAAVKEISNVVASTVAEQAQTGGFGATTELLLSEDPTEFLDGLAASEAFNRHQGEMITELATESGKLELREQQVEAEVADLAVDRKQMAKENDEVEARLAEAKELLSELKAEQRARLEIGHGESEADTSRSTERTPVTNVPASGSAGAAVDYALAQVGDAYVYGASGPDAFDCSGLTMMAWAQAGVSLPHSSSAQMGSGTPVSQSQLQPGDLVFYYSPVSHVGIYIGNGQIVHAANPSSGVEVTSLNSMPYSGAVRPG
jgi:peptidoglycan DL-endopeptidase CwlO